MRIFAVVYALALLSVSALPSAAQPPADRSSGASKRAHAMRVPNGSISVDGRLAESEWMAVEPARDFVQQDPKEGAPASEPSEVRFLYDDENLYVGGMMFDSEPNKALTAELKRDFAPRDGDNICLVLDTFNDKLNAFTFQTNPMGAIRDSQSYDDGRNNNANWDGIWFVKTSTDERGWYFEFSIPFKTLRFSNIEDQVWGMQFMRRIRRKNETTMWNPVPRQFNQFKTSYAGVLEGIRGARPGRNLRIKPFVTSQVRRRTGANDSTLDGGVDAKMGLGAGLVLDATYRTDFSQVEADEQQVNLTRFNLFFPEKREFFLENQGAFQIGPPSTGRSNLVPFFSRTIGLSDTGSPIDIVGGARLTGKVGRNNVGVLNMQTEEEQRPGLPALPSANFSVVRYGREFLSNSSAGAFFMDKQRGGISNRLVGSDIRLNLMRQLNIDALVMRSEKTAIGSGAAWRTGFTYDTALTVYSANYTSLDSSFRDDLGFIPRQGVDILNASVARRMRPQATYRFIREYRPELPYARYTRPNLGVETETLTPALNLDFADGGSAELSYAVNEEALTSPFRIRPQYAIPVGRYRFENGELSYTGSRARVIGLNGAYRFGEFWTGHRKGFTAGARVKFSAKLATTVNFTRDVVTLPGFEFDTNLFSLRVDGSFSTRMFLNAFIQYNSVSREVVSNVRFNFIHHPLSDLFVVFNETRATSGSQIADRSVALKLTHAFSF